MWRMLGGRLGPGGVSGGGRGGWCRPACPGPAGPIGPTVWPCRDTSATRAWAVWTGAYRSRGNLRQPGREAERREQPGVDEVVVPGDQVPGGLDDLDRPRVAPAVGCWSVGPERCAPVGLGGDQ